MADAAAAHATSDRMDQIEDTLANLTTLIQIQHHSVSPAQSLAESAPDPGPGLFTHARATGATSGMRLAL